MDNGEEIKNQKLKFKIFGKIQEARDNKNKTIVIKSTEQEIKKIFAFNCAWGEHTFINMFYKMLKLKNFYVLYLNEELLL